MEQAILNRLWVRILLLDIDFAIRVRVARFIDGKTMLRLGVDLGLMLIITSWCKYLNIEVVT